MKRKTGGSGDRGIEKALVLGLLCLFCSSIPRSLRSSVLQCPDGTPPPCAGQRPPPINPDRIAILPFRVTAADTLLGQGMAELLAPEFNGENGPLAVNMPTVLRVWRRAGGGSRTPLDPAQARRVARELGAGRVIDGSVVALGGTITLTATSTELPAGATRRVGPFTGPADSLQALVGRLVSALLGATGASPVTLQVRMTDSPAAMRAYLEGMARYRVGDYAQAAAAFERAFVVDTLFAGAAFMRVLAGQWGGIGWSGWDSTTWKLRDRLSAHDRILLTAQFGDRFPAQRSPEQAVADHRRAASLLPQSSEAQFWLGDYLYHFGSATNIADDFASARAQMELAYRMDPQDEEIGHLLEIGLFTGDTALVRTRWTARQRMSTDSNPVISAYGRVIARVLHDSTLEGRYDIGQANGWWLALESTIALLPADEVGRVFNVTPGAMSDGSRASEQGRTGATRELPLTAVNTGRLAWLPAQTALVGFPTNLRPAVRDSSRAARPGWRFAAATLALAGDSVVAAALARPTDAAQWDSTGQPLRSAALGVIAALNSHQANMHERTLRLDSILRWSVANGPRSPQGIDGYEGLLLSVAWQALDEPGRALAAVHLDRWTGQVPILLAPRLRQEGRLAAITGDTARAIRAYRRYLSLRRDADPVLVPERDSVQAALARLEGR